MSDVLTNAVCSAGLIGLVGLVFLAVCRRAERANDADQEHDLAVLTTDRHALAIKVCRLERTCAGKEADLVACDEIITDLVARLDGARVLVLMMAKHAGVRVNEDSAGRWRVV